MLDALVLFELAAVSAMLGFQTFEDVSPWCLFGFVVVCAAASAYGFLQGAWPVGAVEAIWMVIAFMRWQKRCLVGVPRRAVT